MLRSLHLSLSSLLASTWVVSVAMQESSRKSQVHAETTPRLPWDVRFLLLASLAVLTIMAAAAAAAHPTAFVPKLKPT